MVWVSPIPQVKLYPGQLSLPSILSFKPAGEVSIVTRVAGLKVAVTVSTELALATL